MDENRKKLYDQLSANYDMGTFDEFDSDLDNEDNQKVAWEAMGGQDGYGDFSMFQQAIARSPQVAEAENTGSAETTGSAGDTGNTGSAVAPTEAPAAPMMEAQQPDWTTTGIAMPGEEDADADISLPDAPNPNTPKDQSAGDREIVNEPDVVNDKEQSGNVALNAEDYSTKSVEELKSNIGVPADKDVTQHDIDSRVTYIESIVDPVQKQAEYDKLMQSLNGLNRYAQAERDAERVVQSIPAEAKVAQYAETVDPAWAKRDEAYGRLVRDGVDYEGKKAPSAAQRGIAKYPKLYNDNIMRVRWMSDDELRRGFATVMDSTAYGADDELRAVDAVPYIIEMNARANGGHAQTMGEEYAEGYLREHPELREGYEKWRRGDEGYRSDADKDPAAYDEAVPFILINSVKDIINNRVKSAQRQAELRNSPIPLDHEAERVNAVAAGVDMAGAYNISDALRLAEREMGTKDFEEYVLGYAALHNMDQDNARQAVRQMVINAVASELISKLEPGSNADYAVRKALTDNLVMNIARAGMTLASGSRAGDVGLFGLDEQAMANFEMKHTTAFDQGVQALATLGSYVMEGTGGGGFVLSGAFSRIVSKGVGAALSRAGGGLFWKRLVAGSLAGAANFGAFEAQMELVHQLKTGERDLGKVLHAFGKGTISGAGFGASGELVGRLFWHSTGWMVPVGEAVKLFGEAATFSAIGYLETGKLTAKDWATNFGMAIGSKVSHAGEYIADVKKRMRGDYGLNVQTISDDYRQELAEKGYGVIAGVMHDGKMSVNDIDRARNELQQMRSDSSVPVQTLQLAEYALNGRVLPCGPVLGYRTERNADGSWTITPLDSSQRPLGASMTVKGTEAKNAAESELKRQAEHNSIALAEFSSRGADVTRSVGDAVMAYCEKEGERNPNAIYKLFMGAMDKLDKDGNAELGDVEKSVLLGVDRELSKTNRVGNGVESYKRTSREAGFDIDKILAKSAAERTAGERKALEEYKTWLGDRVSQANTEMLTNFAKWMAQSEEKYAANSARIAKEFEEKADEFHAHLEDLSGKMDLGNVVVLEHVDQVADAQVRQQIERSERMGEKGVPGWYDADTDTTYVYLPHNENIEDLDRTIMHEQVSHHGLRVLKTQGYNDLCDRVWNSMSDAERARWMNYQGVKNIADKTQRQRAAADEYIAHLAERTDPENEGLWKSFVANAKEQMRKFGIRTDRIGDAELERIIRESYRNLREGRDGDAANGTVEAERGNEAALNTEGEAPREETAEPTTEEVIAPTETVETPPAAEGGETPPPVAEPPVVESEPKVERPTSAVGRVEGTPADMNDWAELLAENDADSLPVEEVQAGLELMEREREQAHRYANGELAEEPSNWEYWAARDGLSEPTRQAEPVATEPPATDTPKEPVVETESQHTEPVATEAPTETAQRDTKLPKGANAEAETMEPSELPMTEHITKMTDAWGDVTRVEVVGQNDNGTTRVRLWFKNRDQRGVETDVDLRGPQPPETPTPPTEPTGDATTADTTTDVTTERPAEVTGSADDQRMNDVLSELLGGDADRIADAQARLNDPNASEFEKQAARTVLRYRQREGRDGASPYETTEDDGVRYRIRTKEPPKKTRKVYKLMRLGEDGKLYPLFIDSASPVELGTWYDADSPNLDFLKTLTAGVHLVNAETGESMTLEQFSSEHPELKIRGSNPNAAAIDWATANGMRWMKVVSKDRGQRRYGGELRSYYNYGINGSGAVETYALRPGWHAGSLPTMRQIGKGPNKNLRDNRFVWVEGEVAADVDYQGEADANPDKDIPDRIPEDGYYLKATNADKAKSQADRVGWFVSGAFKANRIISDAEARRVIDQWNAEHPGQKVEYDYERESGVEFSEEDAARVNGEATESGGVRFRYRDEERRPTFYSNAERAVENVKQGKATAEQWKAMLTKAGGIKAGEDKWMGLSEWLDEHKGQSLTKDDVLQFVRDNGIRMEEVNYGGDVYSNPRMQELQTEYRSIYDNLKAQRSAAYDELAEFNNKMVEKYGTEAWHSLLDEGDKAQHQQMVDDFERKFGAGLDDAAMREMTHRYGDDFASGFDGVVGNLRVGYGFNGIPVDAAKYYLGDINSIESTRELYTTRGLENKREIAFVVPGIEPYQQHDEIHFGPENGGRAVMWVRFGEARDTDGNRVLVIDEVQSNRHQDAREKGYREQVDNVSQERLDAAREAMYDAAHTYNEYEAMLKEKHGFDSIDGSALERRKEWRSRMSDEERHRLKELGDAFKDAQKAFIGLRDGIINPRGVPAAPFEKNWMEVAMKRMLRLAADEGFDKVAWTTGEQQAARYDIGDAVKGVYYGDWESTGDSEVKRVEIPFKDSAFGPWLEVDRSGKIVQSLADGIQFVGHNLSELLGKEIANKVLTDGAGSIEGDGLRIGGEGMKGFYDEMLPRFMNKYGKKWGSKVGDVKLSTPGGEVMHSVDVTEPMKESVMQGQPLFRVRRAPNGKESNLDERQYNEVRTGNFKRWFGDWENDPEQASKVVDANGEPLVVYHQTNRKQYINRKTGQNWDDLDWREREEWDRRSDEEWNDTWEEQDFYTFDNRHARQSVEYPGFFFSPKYDEYHEYGDRTIAAYLDMKNPAIDPDIPNAGVTDTAGRDAMESLMRQGYDGVIRTEDGVPYEYIVFRPEQIKSATENNGEFSRESGDIRFRARDRKYAEADAVPDGVGERLREEGIESDGKGDIRFSHRFPLNDEQRKRSVDDIMRVTGASRRKVTKWLKDVQSLTGLVLSDPDTYANYTPDDRYNAIKTNSDYPQGTVDFNNICRKRKDLTAVWSILQRENPDRIFTAADLETIRQTLIEDGYDVACGLCFVEGRRKFLGEIAQGFIDEMKNGTLKPEVKEILGDETYIPTIEELLVPASSDKLRAEHPQVYDAFVRFNNARGQQAGRLYENYGEYKREILNWDNRKVKAVNDVGGLRIFSFSDFEAHHLLDIVQIIYDCAARGVKIQGYTKVPSFAKAMRATGLKLNRSLIPAGTGIKEVDGKKVLDYDTTEGIDINDRDFLDEESNPNVGNILVGISDEHIRLAMLDPFVDYIIPYHASGIGIELRKLKGIDHWKNYTNSQHDIDKSTGKSAKNQINIYTDVLQAAEAEGRPIRNKREFVEKFLDVARERGLEPRFSQFLNKDKNGNYVYTEGYHKFLIDFKLFDKRGRLVPQEVVRPEFDSDYLKQVLDEYAEGEKVTKDYTSTLAKLRERLGLEQGGDVRLRVRDGRHGSDGIEGLHGEHSGHEAAVEDARRRLESDDASEFERQAARAVINAYGGSSGDTPGGVGPRFRIREPQKAIDDYERAVNSSGFQVTEALQDSMMGLKKLMQAIVGKDAKGKEKAIQDIAGFENAYLKENRLQSESVAQVDEYRTRYYTPLVKAVSALIGKGGKKHRTEATAELTDYMMAKHGLERNIVLAERDATEEFESDANKDGNGNYIRNYDDILAEKREKDYSGLTALTGEADVAAAEDAARQMVDDYEMSHDTTELWQRTKEATDATLDKLHDSGVLSDEAYNRAKTMFEYYIPLRGWDETTSDEVYGYLTGPDGPLNGNVFKHAEGRSSKADDPLATIMMMASDAIRQGNRNVMKQRFLTFVLNNPSDAVSVSRLWLQRDPVTDEWKPVFADLDPTDSPEVVRQKVEQFEQDMAQLAAQDPDNFKHGKQTENIPYKVVNGNIGEHRVLVKHNGQTYVMTINGNPRAAQALNGLSNPDVKGNNIFAKALEQYKKGVRMMSQLVTTYNPKFVVRNFQRDMAYSITSSALVKEGPEYAGKFVKNYAKVGLMGKLFTKWESGTLDRSDTMENLFYEFMHNGGETGFSAPKELKDYKKALDKELRKENSKTRQLLGSFGEFYLRANRAVENRARFAAFVTSMEMGRGVDRSIWDAKEVSVNFNKKGAGARFKDAPNQTRIGKTAGAVGEIGSNLFMFWNAAVQGLTNYGKTVKANPVGAGIHAATMAALGYVMPQLVQAIFGDDDDYYDLPDYVRRNNICFRWRKDMPWMTIPLTQEHAVMYALGDVAAGLINGKKQYLNGEEVFKDFASEISKALPLDFAEGGGDHWLLPSVAKPYFEAYWMNESWTGAPIANQTEWNKQAPEYQRVYKTASQPFVKASEWVNDLTNSDEDSKGLINFNPSKLEYVFKGYAGGLATLFNDCVRMFDVAFGDAEFEAHDIPVAGAMLKSGNPTTKQKEMMRQYYHYRDDAEGAKWELKNREGDALERFKQTDRYERYLVWTEMSKDVDKLKKQMKDNPDLEAEYYAAVERLVSAMREQHAGKRKPSQETIAEVKESERKDSIEALTDKQVHDAMVPLSDNAPQDSVDVKREGIKRAYKSEGLSYDTPSDREKNAQAYERRVDYFDIDEDKVLKGRKDALKKSVGDEFEKMGVKYKKDFAGWDWYAEDDASASIDEIKAYYQAHKAELDEYGILSRWFGSSKGSSGYIKKGFTDGKHDPDEVMKEYREARKEVLARTKQR